MVCICLVSSNWWEPGGFFVERVKKEGRKVLVCLNWHLGIEARKLKRSVWMVGKL